MPSGMAQLQHGDKVLAAGAQLEQVTSVISFKSKPSAYLALEAILPQWAASRPC